jgi:hypothetical protein
MVFVDIPLDPYKKPILAAAWDRHATMDIGGRC